MVKHVNTTIVALVLLAKDAIKKDQDAIKHSLTKLDKSIHDNAVQCMMHAEKHGDTSLMRRLLVEVVDAKSGYRRQGLINWMRKHSPMELSKDTINLTGTDAQGNRRPFKVEEANATPFWNDTDNREMVVRPVFQDNLVSKFKAGLSEFAKAKANTLNGKPIDPSKPFYDGKAVDEVDDILTQIQGLVDKLPQDSTREVRLAQNEIRRLAGTGEEARELMEEAIAKPIDETDKVRDVA
jgi:hypothetical protein